MQNPE